jgi:hypothetical protein
MAYNCAITSNWSLGCKDVGGVQDIFLGAWNGSLLTYTTDATGIIGTFSGTTMSFYRMTQPLKFASWNSAGTSTPENGTVGYKNTVEVTFHKAGQTLSNQLDRLFRGRWRVIVLTQGGTYLLLNATNPANAVSGAYGVGKETTDLNGSTITFEADEPTPAIELTTAAALSLISST